MSIGGATCLTNREGRVGVRRKEREGGRVVLSVSDISMGNSPLTPRILVNNLFTLRCQSLTEPKKLGDMEIYTDSSKLCKKTDESSINDICIVLKHRL